MNHQLLDLLKQRELRNTVPRHAVFKLLKDRGALTTHELRGATEDKLDTASLYRALTLFRHLGVIQDVVIGGKRKVELADKFSPHHHHIACSGCGNTVSIHDEAFERQIEALSVANGFTHQSHSFEITGLCPNCRKI